MATSNPQDDGLFKKLEEEFTPTTPEGYALQAENTFRAALIPAIDSIVHLSQHSPTEKIRLQAAQYIVDRNLGTNNNPLAGELKPLDKFLKETSK